MQHDDSRPAVGRARRWRTARALGAVSVLVLAAAPSALSDDGLPPVDKSPGLVLGTVLSTGLGSAVPSKQFFRVPLTSLWSHSRTSQVPGQMPDVRIEVFAISPPGAPHRYGYFPPIRVRTLAFGIVPAEATITLAQLRENVPDVDPGTPDSDGPKTENVPVPWVMQGPALEAGDHRLTGKADLRISSLVLDGVKVPVGPGCHTKTPATVKLRGIGDYVPVPGGELTGTVDIPAFTNCGMGGEDMSPLVTSMVSGVNNPLQIRQSEIATQPRTPSVTPGPFPLPER